MQTFDRYYQKKMQATDFKALYERECHVCARTMAIFETAAGRSIAMEQLAEAINASTESIELLKDADHCDPQLVQRLCSHFGLPLPDACPRLNPK